MKECCSFSLYFFVFQLRGSKFSMICIICSMVSNHSMCDWSTLTQIKRFAHYLIWSPVLKKKHILLTGSQK